MCIKTVVLYSWTNSLKVFLKNYLASVQCDGNQIGTAFAEM